MHNKQESRARRRRIKRHRGTTALADIGLYYMLLRTAIEEKLFQSLAAIETPSFPTGTSQKQGEHMAGSKCLRGKVKVHWRLVKGRKGITATTCSVNDLAEPAEQPLSIVWMLLDFLNFQRQKITENWPKV